MYVGVWVCLLRFSASRRQNAMTPANDAASCVSRATYQEVVRVLGVCAERNAAHRRAAQAPSAARHVIKRYTLHRARTPQKHIDPTAARLRLSEWASDVH